MKYLLLFCLAWPVFANWLVDLNDGTRIVGKPPAEIVDTKTESIWQITRIEQTLHILHDGEPLTLGLPEGSLALHTQFGTIDISWPSIAKVELADLQAHSVLHYRFDGDVTDDSLNAHDATAHGLKYTEGVSGQAIHTTSSRTHAICKSPRLSLTGWSALTVALWFKVDRFSSYGRLVSRGNVGKLGAFRLVVGGKFGQRELDAAFGVTVGPDQSVGLRLPRFAVPGQWHHVAGVYDGNEVRYYVDGQLAGSEPMPEELRGAQLWEAEDVDLMVGKCSGRRSWHDTHIVGAIDELVIYDRALRPHQIQALMHQQRIKR